MALKNYGVLKGRPTERKRGRGDSPHFQVLINDGGTDYRITINVKSKLSPSELLYIVDENFMYPATDGLESLLIGFNEIKSRPEGKRT